MIYKGTTRSGKILAKSISGILLLVGILTCVANKSDHNKKDIRGEKQFVILDSANFALSIANQWTLPRPTGMRAHFIDTSNFFKIYIFIDSLRSIMASATRNQDGPEGDFQKIVFAGDTSAITSIFANAKAGGNLDYVVKSGLQNDFKRARLFHVLDNGKAAIKFEGFHGIDNCTGDSVFSCCYENGNVEIPCPVDGCGQFYTGEGLMLLPDLRIGMSMEKAIEILGKPHTRNADLLMYAVWDRCAATQGEINQYDDFLCLFFHAGKLVVVFVKHCFTC